MLELQHRDTLPIPRDQAYELVKLQLPALAPYMPSVRKIERISQTVLGPDQCLIVSHWTGDIPLPHSVQRFLPPEILSWKDLATWSDTQRAVDYELESFVGNNLFEARGCNRFLLGASPGTSELEVQCRVEVRGHNLPGIPSWMGRKMVPVLESIVENLLAPNLASFGKGICAYLRDHPETS